MDDTRPMWDMVYHNPDQSPERRLWQAVLISFLQDVQKDYCEWRRSMNGSRNKYWNRIVTHRIVAREPTMEMICGFVEIDHDLVVQKVHDISDGVYELPSQYLKR